MCIWVKYKNTYPNYKSLKNTEIKRVNVGIHSTVSYAWRWHENVDLCTYMYKKTRD